MDSESLYPISSYAEGFATYGIPFQIDVDAANFVNAAEITDLEEVNAIHWFVRNLKQKNLWDKLSVVYPFVGGTAKSHSLNLKDPRNVNAAYRIAWSGGVVHNKMGVTFNGINGYGETYYDMVIMPTINCSTGCYYNTISNFQALSSTDFNVQLYGSALSGMVFGQFVYRVATTPPNAYDIINIGTRIYAGTNLANLFSNRSSGSINQSSHGFLAMSKPLANYNNGRNLVIANKSFLNTSFHAESVTRTANRTIKLGAALGASNSAIRFCNCLLKFVFWGGFLNENELYELNVLVDDLQIRLKRNSMKDVTNRLQNLNITG